ncbi:MAG: type II secretion system protein GspM [Betaproteobacteria bacterium]
MQQRLLQSIAPLRQRWQRLEARQQRIFGGGAALLLLALLFAYVWLPAMRDRDRLIARLPQLRAQLVQMQIQADEIQQLNATTALTPVPVVAPDTAALQNIFGDGARVTPDANRALRVVIPKISYAMWWDRVVDVQSRYQLQIASVSLQSLPGNNREVSVDMLLADRTRLAAPAGSGTK